jgi:OsmC-like protein
VSVTHSDLRDPIHGGAVPESVPSISWKDVTVEYDWDPRGTLAMGDDPIGLSAIRCQTIVRVRDELRGERSERLLRSADKSCVVLNTLRRGVPVESSFALERG